MMHRKHTQNGSPNQARWGRIGLPAILLMAFLPAVLLLAAPIAQADTCIDCHSDKGFMVRDKKLFDYYEQWKLSIHANTEVSCADCHGGNNKARGKKEAHGPGPLSASATGSPTHYRNIPKTCGQCHEEVVKQFQESAHFEHLQGSKDEAQGPSCVTCHGSVNTSVLKVGTVRQTCEKCHDAKEAKGPSVPDRAEAILGDFLSIHRYYRYIGLRGEKDDVRRFFRLVDPMLSNVAHQWHSFDLDAVEEQTGALVQFLKVKRNEILQDRKKRGKKY